MAKQLSQAQQKVLSRWFPELSDATAETLEILMDVDQVSTLLTSLDDVRKGQMVSFESAFGDL